MLDEGSHSVLEVEGGQVSEVKPPVDVGIADVQTLVLRTQEAFDPHLGTGEGICCNDEGNESGNSSVV